MSNLTDLTHAELTLLAKLTAKATVANRNDAPTGKTHVSGQVVLTLDGDVTVGEDYSQRIVLKADPFLLLAVALSHTNGVTIESIAREALEGDPKLAKSVKKQATDAWAAIKAPTVTDCKGKVTINKTASVAVA